VNTDIAWVSDMHGGGYWCVAIDTEYEQQFDNFDDAQDYQDALIADLDM
jgi:hypothetical protein